MHRFPEILISSRKISRQDPGKTRESPGKLTGKLSRVRKTFKDSVRSRISRQGFREPVFPGRETEKKAGNLPGNPGFFLHLIRVSGNFGFSAGNLPGKPRVFSLHLIRVSGGYKILNRKTGKNPRSYQRSGEKSDFPQESRENGAYQGSLWTTL